jgi:uncharacterized phiE125 gp8 family phage protein
MLYTSWRLATATAPAAEPVSSSEAKTHLRVTHSDDDTYISALIAVARSAAEEYLNRSLINRTYDLYVDSFPDGDEVLILPRGPVSSITSITYYDSNNTTQTVTSTNYQIADDRLLPLGSYVWPTTYDRLESVIVRYVAGYGASSASVPADIIHAVKLLIGHFYENREMVVVGSAVSDIPMTVQFLLNPHRVIWGGISDSRR